MQVVPILAMGQSGSTRRLSNETLGHPVGLVSSLCLSMVRAGVFYSNSNHTGFVYTALDMTRRELLRRNACDKIEGCA